MLLLECRSGQLLDSRCISAHPFVVWLCALRPLHCAWLLGCVAKVANVTILRSWRLRGIPTPGAFPSCPPSHAKLPVLDAGSVIAGQTSCPRCSQRDRWANFLSRMCWLHDSLSTPFRGFPGLTHAAFPLWSADCARTPSSRACSVCSHLGTRIPLG